MALGQGNKTKVIRCVSNREPFDVGNLAGGGVVNPSPGRINVGRMDPVERAQFFEDEPDYVVWSYSTPIAWRGKRGWICTQVRYSTTTSQHLGIVKQAVAAK